MSHMAHGIAKAGANGKADGGIDPTSAEARVVLALVNDPEVDFAERQQPSESHLTCE